MWHSPANMVAGKNKEWGISGVTEGGASNSEHSAKVSERTGQQVIVGKFGVFFQDSLNFSHTNHS